jgi:hypothetical protein
MGFIKKFRVPLFTTLALVGTFFIFQNATIAPSGATQSCLVGLQKVYGTLSASDTSACNNGIFSSCIVGWLTHDGGLDQARNNICAGIANSLSSYSGTLPTNVSACVNAWIDSDGALDVARYQDCTNTGFANCMANDVAQHVGLNNGTINTCLTQKTTTTSGTGTGTGTSGTGSSGTGSTVSPTTTTCLDAWLKLDGQVTSARTTECNNTTFASCMAKYLNGDGAMDNARVEVCTAAAFPTTAGATQSACINAWNAFGGTDTLRTAQCNNNAFAGCMANFLANGGIDQQRIDVCTVALTSPSTPQACLLAWERFSGGGLDAARITDCNNAKFASCMASYPPTQTVSQGQINNCVAAGK